MEPIIKLRGRINSYFDAYEPVEIAVGVIFGVIVFRGVKYVAFNFEDAKQKVITTAFGALKVVPGVAKKVKEEQIKARDAMTKELTEHMVHQEKILIIPSVGLSHQEILRRMKELRDFEHKDWYSGKLSGAIYGNDEKHIELLNQAYSLFSITNPLHPDLFPSIRKFEAEVIKMTGKMLHGDEQTCGCITSGGTESIIMAVKSYRDRSNIKNPEIIIPVTAHAAFDKAGGYLKIKVVHVPTDKNGKADLKAVKRAINKNTILIVGSAPNFPHGIIDPIEEMAAMALEHGIGFHTDACLGGFFLPWVQQYSKGKIAPFDFSVPGVTSISCDTHKYGYTTKGTSVVLFKNEELRHGMFFVATEWPGGVYASPSLAGSRPGGLIACCWASLVAIGQEGFQTISVGIYETAQRVKEGITKIPHLELIGDSYSNVIAFGSKDLDIFKVAGAMKAKGWHLSNLQRPVCAHICFTAQHIGKEASILKDLEDSVNLVVSNPAAYKEGGAAIYGMAASFPDRSVVRDIAMIYLDAVLTP